VGEHVPPVELPAVPPVPVEAPVAPLPVAVPADPALLPPVEAPVVPLPVAVPAEPALLPPVEASVVPLPVAPADAPLLPPVEAPVLLPVELDEALLPHDRQAAIAPIAATFDVNGETRENRFIGQLPFYGVRGAHHKKAAASRRASRHVARPRYCVIT
jgi:hypothetical protein